MFAAFIVSLLGLCAACVASFIAAYRLRSKLLMVFVPIIATCGSFIYFSYVSVLGYPVELQWKELPSEITVIYFHIENKESITLWLFDGDTTRLVKLPYEQAGEDVLESGREKMGKGAPMTLKKTKGKGGKFDGDEGVEGDGEEGDGEGGEKGAPGDGKGKKGKGGRQGQGGWRYKVESFGEAIPGGSLPPKF